MDKTKQEHAQEFDEVVVSYNVWLASHEDTKAQRKRKKSNFPHLA